MQRRRRTTRWTLAAAVAVALGEGPGRALGVVEVPLGEHRAGQFEGAVDEFLDRARASFEVGADDLTSVDVRRVAFPLVRHGYAIASVDAALGRIAVIRPAPIKAASGVHTNPFDT